MQIASELKLLAKLAAANISGHKIRFALTVTAIALSCSLVIAVTSGYASAAASALKVFSQFIGTTDATITRRNDTHGGIHASLLDQLRADPAVAKVNGRLEIQNGISTADGQPLAGRAAQIIGIARPDDTAIEALSLESGEWFDGRDANAAVVDQVAAEQLHVKVGETFILPGLDHKLVLRISGIVHKPRILASAVMTVYLPLQTVQQFSNLNDPPMVSRVLIDLKRGSNEKDFFHRWQSALTAIDPQLQMKLASDNRQQLDRNLANFETISFLAATISMLAATFIVFSALSMGVAERQRTLAMLRAIGAFRGQLGRLVMLEGLCVSVVGVLIGVPMAAVWISLLVWKFHDFFISGATVSWRGVGFAAGGSILTCLAASLLPALRAMRASPLDAMAPQALPSRPRGIYLAAIIGAVLLCIDPLILLNRSHRSAQFYAHYFLGIPALFIGFFLLAPLVVKMIEAVVGPLIAKMLGVRFELLRQQLSGHVWRAAGTAAALMVGLSVLIVTQTQGMTAIRGWKLPDKFPDLFIFSPSGITDAEQKKIEKTPGIRSDQVMAIAIASPQLGSNLFAIAGAALMPDATMYLGVEPDIAMKMMELQFLQGNQKDAMEMLKSGRHIIVTQEFQTIKNLGVGDKLPLKTSQGMVDFIIAGVVWSPGLDVINAHQDLSRQFDQRTAASVFGTISDAKKYFGVDRYHLLAANLSSGINRDKLLEQVRVSLGQSGLQMGDVRQIKFGIQKSLTHLLAVLSWLAYAAMAISSLGVANTIMASVRTRRWQFGVMRAIGVTRGQLVRLVIAEAMLLGLCGALLGLGAGAEMAMNARRSWAQVIGYNPPAFIPWSSIGIGVAIVMAVALLASIWPARSLAREQPLSLLQAGRGAA